MEGRVWEATSLGQRSLSWWITVSSLWKVSLCWFRWIVGTDCCRQKIHEMKQPQFGLLHVLRSCIVIYKEVIYARCCK